MRPMLQQRNARVRAEVNRLEAQHPQWRRTAVVEAVSQKFYLSERTVEAILRGEGRYAGQT